MSSFTRDLVVRIEQGEQHGRGVFTLLESFVYEIGHLGSGKTITVPQGFISDGCSIPWFARAFLPVLGRAAKAGVLHDFLLFSGWSQEDSAEVFMEALGVLKVPTFNKYVMYWAVRYWPWISRVEQEI